MNGRADAFLVGGGEVLSEPLYLAFRKLGTLAEGDERFAPGAPDSEGMRLGEGAVYLVVERLGRGREARRASATRSIIGYGNTFEPPESEASVVHASPRSVQRTIEMALEDAGSAGVRDRRGVRIDQRHAGVRSRGARRRSKPRSAADVASRRAEGAVRRDVRRQRRDRRGRRARLVCGRRTAAARARHAAASRSSTCSCSRSASTATRRRSFCALSSLAVAGPAARGSALGAGFPRAVPAMPCARPRSARGRRARRRRTPRASPSASSNAR